MADETPATKEPVADAPAQRRAPRKPKAPVEKDPTEAAPASETPEKKGSDGPRAPARPTLTRVTALALRQRDEGDDRRPRFVRTASNRYWRIGRWQSWRRPRGLQSKQRRHYGYRPVVVSIGFRSPRRARGLTPTGFQPIIVRTLRDIDGLDAAKQAAVIARTVGTKKRLVLEERARKLGVHVLNPIVTGGGEE